MFKYLPHDILSVSGVVPLCILVAVKEYGHGSHVVEQFSGGQNPEISPRINAAIAMAKTVESL